MDGICLYYNFNLIYGTPVNKRRCTRAEIEFHLLYGIGCGNKYGAEMTVTEQSLDTRPENINICIIIRSLFRYLASFPMSQHIRFNTSLSFGAGETPWRRGRVKFHFISFTFSVVHNFDCIYWIPLLASSHTTKYTNTKSAKKYQH